MRTVVPYALVSLSHWAEDNGFSRYSSHSIGNQQGVLMARPVAVLVRGQSGYSLLTCVSNLQGILGVR